MVNYERLVKLKNKLFMQEVQLLNKTALMNRKDLIQKIILQNRQVSRVAVSNLELPFLFIEEYLLLTLTKALYYR